MKLFILFDHSSIKLYTSNTFSSLYQIGNSKFSLISKGVKLFFISLIKILFSFLILLYFSFSFLSFFLNSNSLSQILFQYFKYSIQ